MVFASNFISPSITYKVLKDLANIGDVVIISVVLLGDHRVESVGLEGGVAASGVMPVPRN